MPFAVVPWTELDDANVASLYQSGLTVAATAKAIGRCYKKTSSALARLGLLRKSSVAKLYTLDHSFFASDAPAPAYWAGFIAADGSVRKDDLRIAIKSDDRVHLERFAHDIGYNGPVRDYIRGTTVISGRETKRPTSMCRIGVWSPQFVADLRRFGVVRNKSRAMQPWSGPPELMPHYWRGLLDGDGSWGFTNHGRYAFCNLCGTEAVVSAFAAFVYDKVGYKSRVWATRNAFITTIQSSHAVQALVRVIYADSAVAMPRKQAIAEAILAREWKPYTGEKPH